MPYDRHRNPLVKSLQKKQPGQDPFRSILTNEYLLPCVLITTPFLPFSSDRHRNPLVKSLQKKLPGQDHFRSILTNEYLEVKGSKGTIFAFGDAATIEQPTALSYAEELFKQVSCAWIGAKLNYSFVMLFEMLQPSSSQPH